MKEPNFKLSITLNNVAYVRELTSGLIPCVTGVGLDMIPFKRDGGLTLVKVLKIKQKNSDDDIVIIPPISQECAEELFSELLSETPTETQKTFVMSYTEEDMEIISFLMSSLGLSEQSCNQHAFYKPGQHPPKIHYPRYNGPKNDDQTLHISPMITGYVNYYLHY